MVPIVIREILFIRTARSLEFLPSYCLVGQAGSEIKMVVPRGPREASLTGLTLYISCSGGFLLRTVPMSRGSLY
jgi:hypothetical protein